MGSLKWDDAALKKLVGEAARPLVEQKTAAVLSSANSMGAGFRTGKFYRDHKKPPLGDTQARYAGDVRDQGGVPVGVVHPANYAAIKDNHDNNTLLKAMG